MLQRNDLRVGAVAALCVSGALLAPTLGWPLLQVAYNGGQAALNGLARAEIDAVFLALPLALPYLESGRLPALGLASRQRFDLLPQLPTLAEAGHDLVWEGWFALYASPRMAPQLHQRLQAAVQNVLASGGVRSALLLRGLVPAAADLAGFAARVHAEQAVAVNAISAAGP
jgi:tripartite-type tricarboxylate transporter receptor subunit TctC